MKNIFTKTSLLIIFCLNMATIFPALRSAEPIVGVDDIINATKTLAPAAQMPTQCVLDFSRGGVQGSALKIAGYLLSNGGIISDDSHKKLYWVDFSYLMCESFAAWTRLNPQDCPKLSALFADPNSVYTAFGKIINTMDTTERALSELADLKKCNAFVNQTIDKDLPLLLNELFKALPASLSSVADLAKDHQKEIVSVAQKFAPTIAQLLNTSYIGLSKAAAAADKAFKKLEEEVSNCGCFSWCK